MYGNELDELAKVVSDRREENLKFEHARLTADEKDALLKEYHPDRIESQFTKLKIGPNKGEKAPLELAAILEAKPRIDPSRIDLSRADYETDVLVIGGGGAGTSAAIEANNAGAKVLLVTKLRVGDANTMMAERRNSYRCRPSSRATTSASCRPTPSRWTAKSPTAQI